MMCNTLKGLEVWGILKKFERKSKFQQIDLNESWVLTKPNKWSYLLHHHHFQSEFYHFCLPPFALGSNDLVIQICETPKSF